MRTARPASLPWLCGAAFGLLVGLSPAAAELPAEPAPSADAFACPPGTTEAKRPPSPCLDRAESRIWTPRIEWPIDERRAPATLAEEMKGVVALLRAHPEILGVRIEGHRAYDPAFPAYGHCRSCERARALMRALLEAGIDPARIETQGYGESKPLFDYRDPVQNGLNQRFEWHVTRWAPELDRAAVAALAQSWARCFEEAPSAAGIELVLDAQGRLTTVVLDGDGPARCLTEHSVGRRLADGPMRVRWPAADRPTPYPPAPRPPPMVEGRGCPPGTDEAHRPAKACVSADGTRIWLPPMPRHPKYTRFPMAARPIADDLLALLEAAPEIARVRIEMHDYRDPNAGDYGKCRPCSRAGMMAEYLMDRGLARERVRFSGHHGDRPAPGRSIEETRALGSPRYEVWIEAWVRKSEPRVPRQGEAGRSPAVRRGDSAP